MAQIMQDKYILGQSIGKGIENLGQEIRLDLKLKPNTNDLNGGSVTGTVTDANNAPVKNALVKLMSTTYDPLMHVLTDSNGNFSLVNINPGSYTIFCIAQGMQLNQGSNFTISELQNIIINFTLQPDPAMQLSIIAGDLINSTSSEPVGGAIVSLFSISNNTETLESITYTNEYGQFVFRELQQGSYIVKINALGYTDTSATANITSSGQIVSMNVPITPNPQASKGTVSGVITDSTDQPIDRADVILYEVNNDNSLTPIAFTKTNQNGIYLFGNIPQGYYKVKSNQMEVVNINI